MGGRIYGFFRTGWRPLALWFAVSILLALVIAQVTVPVVAGPSEMSAPDNTSPGAENETLGTLAAAASQQPLAGVIATQSSWNALVNNTMGLVVGGARSFATQMNTATIAWVFGIFLFGYIAYTGYRSRRQVLVGKFEESLDTGADGKSPLGKFPEGVSTLITGELHRLRSLYAEVDDRRAIASVGGRSGQLDYTIQAGDTGQMIKDAISTENKVTIGTIDIPIGAIAGVFSKFFSGPQITGGFHRDGSLIVLNAFMSGPQSRSWRVEGSIVTGTVLQVDTGVQVLPVSTELRSIRLVEKSGKIENLDLMVKELACRIFTDLTSGGTTKWRATYYFTEGLKDYRSCLLSRKNQIRNLKNAERRFLEAISEDSTFDLAWYNLGVVYTELGRLDAAEQAFLKAVEMSPGTWEPYYALALNRFNRLLSAKGYIGLGEHAVIDETRLRDIIHPCEQAVTLNPDNPHLHILLGVCYRILALKKRELNADVPDPAENSLMCIHNACRHHRIAGRNAWYALCSYQIRRTGIPVTKASNIQKVSTTALWDLSRTYFADAMCHGTCPPDGAWVFPRPRRSLSWIASVLRQALLIERNNALLLKSLGIVCYHQEKYADASRSFESATQIDPDNQKLWMLFALSAQRAGYVNKREFAAGKILEYPSWLEEALSPRWRDEIEQVLCREGLCPDICRILEFQKRPDMGENPYDPATWSNNDEYVKALKSMRDSVARQEKNPGTLWTLAHLSYYIANHSERLDTRMKKYQDALRYLSDKSLEPDRTRDWARGIIAYELASNCNLPAYYRESYQYFMDSYPLEIKKRRIDLALVNLLLGENNIYEALSIASTAKHENPLGFSQLNAWGRCLIQEGNYIQALFAFESALLLEPYDLNTLENIGYCYWMLGNFCQKRDEKEDYWRQAIRYYEDAKEALSEKEHQDSPDPFWLVYGNDYISIPFSLGCCYMNISEYGNAVSNFDQARELSRYYSQSEWDPYYCVLRSAEALLHKRDHYTSERYFSYILNTFKSRVFLETKSSGSEPFAQREARIFFTPTNSQLDEIPFIGEIFVRALIGQAYSYAERDAGLDDAQGLIQEADRILQAMRNTLEPDAAYMEKEPGPGKTPEKQVEYDEHLSDVFLAERVPLIEAELHDRRGWLIFKKKEKDNLEKAKEEILKALSIKQDADYYFHLAHVCAALSRETAEKESNARLALAHCDHVLDMAPRKNLEYEAAEFRKQINEQLSKLPIS